MEVPSPQQSDLFVNNINFKDDDELEPATSNTPSKVGQYSVGKLVRSMHKSFYCYKCALQDILDFK